MGLRNWACEKSVNWSFVIDTDSYAGNVERSICAYVVGVVDEYGAHQVEAEIEAFRRDYPNQNPFEDLVESRLVDPGDDGYHRAFCDLVPTPGRGNEGGRHYTVTPEHPAKWPAFESVAIFLSREPTAEEVATLKARALALQSLPRRKEWDARPRILGFRLMQEIARVSWESV